MNTVEAIKFLEGRNYKVYCDATLQKEDESRWNWDKMKDQMKDQKLFRIWHHNYCFGIYTGRELIKFVKNYRTTPSCVSQNFKKSNNSKMRRSTRDTLQKEDFDKIPLDGAPKEEDMWNWD